MESQQEMKRSQMIVQLLELGFDEDMVMQAVKHTLDKQQAAQIIMKLIENPDFDPTKQELNPFNQIEPVVPLTRPKMLFVVNNQLKMGKGKICAQVGHAVIGAYMQIEEEARFDQRAKNRLERWEFEGTPKIAVKCDTEAALFEIQKKLEALKIGINCYIVEDAGHTQIKAGSKTVLGIGPAFSEEIDPITKHLKLL